MANPEEIKQAAQTYVDALKALVSEKIDHKAPTPLIVIDRLYAKLAPVLKQPNVPEGLLKAHQHFFTFQTILDYFILNSDDDFYLAVREKLDPDLIDQLIKRENQAIADHCNYKLNLPPFTPRGVDLSILNRFMITPLMLQVYLTKKMKTHANLNPVVIQDDNDIRLNILIHDAKVLQKQGVSTRFQCIIGSGHMRTLDFSFKAGSDQGSCIILDTADNRFHASTQLAAQGIKVYQLASTIPAWPGGLAVLSTQWGSLQEAEHAILNSFDPGAMFDTQLIVIQIQSDSDQEPQWFASCLRSALASGGMLGGMKPSLGQWVKLEMTASLVSALGSAPKNDDLQAIIKIANSEEPLIKPLITMIDEASNGMLISAIVAQKDSQSCLVMSALMAIETSKSDIHQLCEHYVESHPMQKSGRFGSERMKEFKGVTAIIPWSAMPDSVLKVAQSTTFFMTHAQGGQKDRLLTKYHSSGNPNFVVKSLGKMRVCFSEAIEGGGLSLISYPPLMANKKEKFKI